MMSFARVAVGLRPAVRGRSPPLRAMSIFDPKRAMDGDVFAEWREFDALRSEGLVSPDAGLLSRMALFHVWRVHLRRNEHFDLREFTRGASMAFEQMMATINALEANANDSESLRALSSMVSPSMLHHLASALDVTQFGKDEHGRAQIRVGDVRSSLIEAVPFESADELVAASAKHGFAWEGDDARALMAAGLWFELTVAVTAEETVAVDGETDPASESRISKSKVAFFGPVGPNCADTGKVGELARWRVVARYK